MARSSDGGMPQGSSKHPMGARARAGRSTPGRTVAAKPAVGIRGGRAAHGLRPVGQPAREPADARSTPGSRAYLQWAAFATGTRDEDGGFGAYFVNEPPDGASRYTWTPAADR
jgi:hypothetical protein